MGGLTEKQEQALNITSPALGQIRILARAPVTPKTMAAIHDLAEALENVPNRVTWLPEDPKHASWIDQGLDQDVETAGGVFKREGFPMVAFPPDIKVRDVDRSRYVISGASFSIPPGIASQYATTDSRRGLRLGSTLALFFRRIFG